MNLKILSLINKRKDKKKIILLYEKEILDTGGGVKNAFSVIKNDNLLIGRMMLLVKIIDNKNIKNIIIKYKLNRLNEIIADSLIF